MKEMHFDKLKGTLVDFNRLEHVLDDMDHVGAWQLEIRKVDDDPHELDELILHVNSLNGAKRDELERMLDRRLAEETEIHANRVVFHTVEEMRELQGVGTQLKEQRVVDHRPRSQVKAPAVHAHA
jgi:hypothetical protein